MITATNLRMRRRFAALLIGYLDWIVFEKDMGTMFERNACPSPSSRIMSPGINKATLELEKESSALLRQPHLIELRVSFGTQSSCAVEITVSSTYVCFEKLFTLI